MPLPMVHLAVAVQLAARMKQFPSPAFLLGSLSPDAIHMRPDTTDDDKAVTHLVSPPDTPDHAAVQALIRRHRYKKPPFPAFTAGYAAHLLTDRLWTKNVAYPFRDRITAEIGDDAMRNLYYTETDQTDFNLYHRETWRPQVWTTLAAAEAPDFKPFLSAGEIDGWRVGRLDWFTDSTHEPNITPQHITDAVVADFIVQAVGLVDATFAAWGIIGLY